MKKSEEVSDPQSCWNKAADDELLFVLLERDDAAADTIRYWIAKRIELGKNAADDRQLRGAAALANRMEGR